MDKPQIVSPTMTVAVVSLVSILFGSVWLATQPKLLISNDTTVAVVAQSTVTVTSSARQTAPQTVVPAQPASLSLKTRVSSSGFETGTRQMATDTAAFTFRHATVTPLAGYQVTARVLRSERYYFDQAAKFSPIDVVLGWDKMAQPSVYSQFTIRQSGRWYFWQSDTMPVSQSVAVSQSANTHLIPATQVIEKQILQLQRHDVVQLDGFLVRVQTESGWTWKSSLSRQDTGDGACEVMFVTSVRHVTETAASAAE